MKRKKPTYIDRRYPSVCSDTDRDAPTIAPINGAIASIDSQVNGFAPVTALAEDEADRVQPVREVVCEDGDEHEHSRRRVQAEGQPDSEAVDEAVKREACCAQHSHLFMCASLLGLVAVVEDEQPLGQEEEKKACTDECADAFRVPDCVDRLREHVEESDSQDDPARERDQGRELAMQAQRDNASDERRGDHEQGRRNRDPGHRQSLQVP